MDLLEVMTFDECLHALAAKRVGRIALVRRGLNGTSSPRPAGIHTAVIPAQAGIHVRLGNMDPRFRGDDGRALAGMTTPARADPAT